MGPDPKAAEGRSRGGGVLVARGTNDVIRGLELSAPLPASEGEELKVDVITEGQ